MTHSAAHILLQSLLHIFDAAEYPGVREHFSAKELERIDKMRAYPETHEFTKAEKHYVVSIISKAVLTAI